MDSLDKAIEIVKDYFQELYSRVQAVYAKTDFEPVRNETDEIGNKE